MNLISKLTLQSKLAEALWKSYFLIFLECLEFPLSVWERPLPIKWGLLFHKQTASLGESQFQSTVLDFPFYPFSQSLLPEQEEEIM